MKVSSGGIKFTVDEVEPARELTERVTVRCECGYYRDCGYMDVTAERLAELHRARWGCVPVISRTPADPLTAERIKKKIQKRQPNGYVIVDFAAVAD